MSMGKCIQAATPSATPSAPRLDHLRGGDARRRRGRRRRLHGRHPLLWRLRRALRGLGGRDARLLPEAARPAAPRDAGLPPLAPSAPSCTHIRTHLLAHPPTLLTQRLADLPVRSSSEVEAQGRTHYSPASSPTHLLARVQIFPGHEYTEMLLSMAVRNEPTNAAARRCLRQAQDKRRLKQPTVPSTMADELEYNPQLRADAQTLARLCGCFN